MGFSVPLVEIFFVFGAWVPCVKPMNGRLSSHCRSFQSWTSCCALSSFASDDFVIIQLDNNSIHPRFHLNQTSQPSNSDLRSIQLSINIWTTNPWKWWPQRPLLRMPIAVFDQFAMWAEWWDRQDEHWLLTGVGISLWPFNHISTANAIDTRSIASPNTSTCASTVSCQRYEYNTDRSILKYEHQRTLLSCTNSSTFTTTSISNCWTTDHLHSHRSLCLSTYRYRRSRFTTKWCGSSTRTYEQWLWVDWNFQKNKLTTFRVERAQWEDWSRRYLSKKLCSCLWWETTWNAYTNTVTRIR